MQCCLRKEADKASMRPRPEDRGEREPLVWQVFSMLSLQCGHGPKTVENWRYMPEGSYRPSFNAATARSRGELSANLAALPAVPEASMRPRPEDRGEPELVHSICLGITAASMRPRPEAVENVRSAFHLAEQERASMRPRPEAVENLVAVAAEEVWWRLQCGHGPKPWRTSGKSTWVKNWQDASMRPRPEAVENLGVPDCCCAERGLQCGHGPKTVENFKVKFDVGDSL